MAGRGTRGPLGRKRYSFLSTADWTMGEVASNRDTGEFLNDSHNGSTREDPQRYKSNVWGKPSFDRLSAWTSIHLSGASLRSFSQCSKMTSPFSQYIAGLTSRVLMMRRSDFGQTMSNHFSDTERGAGSSGSQGPPAAGPDMRALRGVWGTEILNLLCGQG